MGWESRLGPVLIVSALGSFVACVGDNIEVDNTSSSSSGDVVTDDAGASSSGWMIEPPDSSSSSSSSSGSLEDGGGSSSSSSSGEHADADAAPEPEPPDPRCSDTVQMLGQRQTTVACGLFSSVNPSVPMVEAAYDLNWVGGAIRIGSSPCPTEQWNASISVRQDGNAWLLVISIEVAQGTFHYHVRARVSADGKKLLVSPLCPGEELPFDDGEVSFSLTRKDNLPRDLSLSLKHPANGNVRSMSFTQR